MSKLYFSYGTVQSSKTLNLLAVAHNYDSSNVKCVTIKPSLDTRTADIVSRAGLSRPADIVLRPEQSITEHYQTLSSARAVLVDEVQFLSEAQIIELRKLSIGLIPGLPEVPVMTFGLRTDSEGNLWPASALLMAMADEIAEIKTICAYCTKRAVFSKAVREYKSQIAPSWSGYIPVCPYHYFSNETRGDHGKEKEDNSGAAIG